MPPLIVECDTKYTIEGHTESMNSLKSFRFSDFMIYIQQANNMCTYQPMPLILGTVQMSNFSSQGMYLFLFNDLDIKTF